MINPTPMRPFGRCHTYKQDGPLHTFRCPLGLWSSTDTNYWGALGTAYDLWQEHYRAGAYYALLAKKEDKPFAQEHNWNGKPNPDYDCS